MDTIESGLRIQLDGQYRTRSGRAVRILAVDLPGIQPIAVLVLPRVEGDEADLEKYRADGRFMLDGEECRWDLISEDRVQCACCGGSGWAKRERVA